MFPSYAQAFWMLSSKLQIIEENQHKGSCSYSREFKFFSILRGKFYIPKYRLIGVKVQGGYSQKIDFFKIV